MPEIIATHLDNAMGLSDRKLAAPNSSHNSTTDAATVQVRPIQYCTHTKKLKLKILAKSDQN